MKTIYIYCEGLTEESFINTVLYPYFFALGITRLQMQRHLCTPYCL